MSPLRMISWSSAMMRRMGASLAGEPLQGFDGAGGLLGLGDAPNDLPLLRAVDDAVIVPGGMGVLHPDLVTAFPHATHAPSTGPAGWNAVVLDWLAATEPQS